MSSEIYPSRRRFIAASLGAAIAVPATAVLASESDQASASNERHIPMPVIVVGVALYFINQMVADRRKYLARIRKDRTTS
jgi:hypothetical protein